MSWQKLFILLADYILSSSPPPSPPFPLEISQKKIKKKSRNSSPFHTHTPLESSPSPLSFSLFFPVFQDWFSLFSKRKKSSETQCFQGIGKN